MSFGSGKIEFGGRGNFRETNSRQECLLEKEKKKKSRRRKLVIWLLIDLAVVALVLALLLYKPSRYHPVLSTLAPDPNDDRVHPYFSRELMPKLYNGAQRQRPFEMVVLDQRLNEAIARETWYQDAGGIFLSAPQVLFTPGSVILMGTASVEGAEFVVTIELGPQLGEDGCLNLLVRKVKVGAMNITPLAKAMAKKIYRERLAAGPVDMENIGTKIAASLLAEEPFDPVFTVEDKRVRLTGFDLADGQLTAQFAPAPPPRR
jgi:hypothetical protein